MMSKGKIKKSMIGYRAAMVLFAVLICFTVLPVSAASPSASSVVASMKKKIGSSNKILIARTIGADITIGRNIHILMAHSNMANLGDIRPAAM